MKYSIRDMSDPVCAAQCDEALQSLQYGNVFYSSSMMAYYSHVLKDQFIANDSFAVLDGDNVVGIVPLFRCRVADDVVYGVGRLHNFGPLVFFDEGTKQHKAVMQCAFEIIEKRARKNGVIRHRVYYPCATVMDGLYYYNPALDYEYVAEDCLGLVLPLDRSEDDLWKGLRKSYKSLINKGRRSSSVKVIDSANYSNDDFLQYERLHGLCSGRMDRDRKSFQAQADMIRDGLGFLVLIQQGDQTLAAHVFYSLGRSTFYASSAQHPDVDSADGIGHVGVWEGVLHSRKCGVEYFDFGILEGEFEGEKINQINFFKRGFGGRQVLVFRAHRCFS